MAAVLAFLGAVPLSPARAEVPADLFVMAMRIDDVISLDPAEVFEFTGAEVSANIYERLLYFDPEDVTKIMGGVAESWQVSADGRRFTFRIRPGMTFHSGNPVTAADAAYSLRRVIRLNLAPAFILAQFGFTPENVDARIYAPDAETLVMETDRAYSPALVYACLTADVASIVDSKVVKSHAVDGDLGNGWLRTRSAGSGPFRLRVWKPNELIILDRFADYWRGAPPMRTAFIRHIGEPGVQRLLLERGDIDVARNLTPDQAAAIRSRKDMRLRFARKGSLFYLALNQKNAFLGRPEVRKAVKYLVDYGGIAGTILRGQAAHHQTIIPAGYFGVLEEQPYELNLAKAKELLGPGGGETRATVSLDVRNAQTDLEIAQSIQATFAAAGIAVELVPGDGRQVLTKYRARNHDLYYGKWGPDYQDPHSNAQAFASNPDNSDQGEVKTLAWRNAWDIPELTHMTRAAVLERNAGKRAAAYHEIQRRVLEDSPFVILYQEVDMAVERANVHGFVMGPAFDTVSYRGVTKSAPQN